MPVKNAEIDLLSEISDDDLPFDVDVTIDDAEYVRLMRRIGSQDGAAGTPVSAFNSSI